jgi:hypothetical protein
MAAEKMSTAHAREILHIVEAFHARGLGETDEATYLARRLRTSRTRAVTLIRMARAALTAETPRL